MRREGQIGLKVLSDQAGHRASVEDVQRAEEFCHPSEEDKRGSVGTLIKP